MSRKVTLCAAHVAPIYLDAAATTEKICAKIAEAARAGAELIAFPESFLPGFPLWPALQAPIRNHEHFKRFAAQSVRIPGPEIVAICTAARQNGITVSLGISEASPTSVGCLWNANLLIGPDGSILNHHRKLVPTFFEKMIWAPGDGEGLRVKDTAVGRIGALICGENTNPLARFALMAQGEQVHVSSYPPTWPTHEPDVNERYDLASAIRIRAGAHSFEAKVFNIVASSRLDDSALRYMAEVSPDAADILERSPRGISAIIGPSGLPVAETASDQDTLLVETVDLDDCIVPKQFHDVVGYYNRFDIFELRVNRRSLDPAVFAGTEAPVRAHSYEDLERSLAEVPASG